MKNSVQMAKQFGCKEQEIRDVLTKSLLRVCLQEHPIQFPFKFELSEELIREILLKDGKIKERNFLMVVSES